MESNKITEEAHSLGLGIVSSHIWNAACMKHGSGGTDGAIKMYENIMKVLIAEFKNVPYDSSLFDEFWKAYPNKKAKPMALKSWKRLKPDNFLFQKIMAALTEHKKTDQWVKDDGRFIPMPSTWLNNQRWEDELKIEKSSANESKFGHL